ncbi:hypothetical protein ACOMHN_014490 [Nucella lapillus]
MLNAILQGMVRKPSRRHEWHSSSSLSWGRKTSRCGLDRGGSLLGAGG